MRVLLIILTFVYAIAGLIIYHKLFSVLYFDLGKGCLKEISFALILGLFLAALTVELWYVSIPVIIFVLVAIFKRKW